MEKTIQYLSAGKLRGKREAVLVNVLVSIDVILKGKLNEKEVKNGTRRM